MPALRARPGLIAERLSESRDAGPSARSCMGVAAAGEEQEALNSNSRARQEMVPRLAGKVASYHKQIRESESPLLPNGSPSAKGRKRSRRRLGLMAFVREFAYCCEGILLYPRDHRTARRPIGPQEMHMSRPQVQTLGIDLPSRRCVTFSIGPALSMSGIIKRDIVPREGQSDPQPAHRWRTAMRLEVGWTVRI